MDGMGKVGISGTSRTPQNVAVSGCTDTLVYYMYYMYYMYRYDKMVGEMTEKDRKRQERGKKFLVSSTKALAWI